MCKLGTVLLAFGLVASSSSIASAIPDDESPAAHSVIRHSVSILANTVQQHRHDPNAISNLAGARRSDDEQKLLNKLSRESWTGAWPNVAAKDTAILISDVNGEIVIDFAKASTGSVKINGNEIKIGIGESTSEIIDRIKKQLGAQSANLLWGNVHSFGACTRAGSHYPSNRSFNLRLG